MKMRLLILLASLVLSSCASLPQEYAYPIEKPSCQADEIIKWCLTGWDKYEAVGPDESCPENSLTYSVELQVDCFRKIDHYISEMEIRLKSSKPR